VSLSPHAVFPRPFDKDSLPVDIFLAPHKEKGRRLSPVSSLAKADVAAVTISSPLPPD
jgi:hypothetical protein